MAFDDVSRVNGLRISVFFMTKGIKANQQPSPKGLDKYVNERQVWNVMGKINLRKEKKN